MVKIGDKVNDIKRLIIDRVKNTSKLLKNKVTAYWTKRFEDFLEERIKRKNISNKVDDVLYEVEVKKMADEVSEEVIEGMNREVMKSLGEIYDISEDRITHVIKGNFDETGRFTGGLHSAKGMKNVIKKGKNQIRDMEGNIIDSIEKFNALVHNNGVKEVKIWNVKRNIWEPKTLFPDEWDMEEIVKAGDYVKKNYITEDITELFKDGAAQVVEKKYIYKEKDYFIREVFYKDGSINTWYILE